MTDIENRDLWDVLAEIEHETAESARNEAIARVEQNADDLWMNAALAIVTDLAERRPDFTTDSVWLELRRREFDEPRESRAMGAIMRRAARAGLVVKTDRVVNSSRSECHARPIAVWRSLVHVEDSCRS